MKKNSQSSTPSNADTSSVVIRDANEADVPFIFNSWLKSFRPFAGPVSPIIYYEFQHKLIEQLLQRSVVRVACSVTDTNEIYAYLVSELIDDVSIIHYAYTKHTFRGLGLQRKLGLSSSGFYTHRTNCSRFLYPDQLIYNPYLAGAR